jgi:HEAT repeat protein
LELAREEDSDLRWSATEALGWLGGERALERLLELTKDGAWEVQLWAVEALGRIGSERALDRLLELTREELTLREWATRALWRIAWKNKVRINPTS